MDDNFHKVYVGAHSRERRSLLMTRKETASLEREQQEREYERFAEQNKHRLNFFQKVDYDDRYRYKRICKFFAYILKKGNTQTHTHIHTMYILFGIYIFERNYYAFFNIKNLSRDFFQFRYLFIPKVRISWQDTRINVK